MFCFVLFGSLQFINAQTKAEKKEAKAEKKQIEFEKIQILIDSKAFTFIPKKLFSHQGITVNVTDKSYALEIDKNNIATAYLPYFGQINNVSDAKNGGINFCSKLSNYVVTKNSKKQRIIIKADANNKYETFNLSITIHSNGYATLYVSSNNRDGISYNGKIMSIDELPYNEYQN